jgi:type IV pilus assembly protein PilY1
LDVTEPGAFAEDKAAQTVMWEFTDKDDPHLGNVYGKPVIRQMANKQWAAIVSGGYNNSDSKSGTDNYVSGTGNAYLFIIFLKGPSGPGGTWTEGTDYIRISTDVGTTDTPNGLGDPFAADALGADGIVDFVYAGDLRGNLWKFDVRSPDNVSTSQWKQASNRLKLFTAKDASGNVQPITSRPEGIVHPSRTGYIIVFGTGKYIEQNDLKSAYWKTQSFYGIWDKNDGTVVNDRSELVKQDVTTESTFRTLTNKGIDSAKRGWLIDFPVNGERSVFRPLLIYGRLIFTTLIPSVNPCDFGGTSFLMVISPSTGGRIDAPVLDTNADKALNASDKIGANALYASGVQAKSGIAPTPVVIIGRPLSGLGSEAVRYYGTDAPGVDGENELLGFAIIPGGGRIDPTLIGLVARSGRVTWREVLAR